MINVLSVEKQLIGRGRKMQKYRLLQTFSDCVLLKRDDTGIVVLRDNEGDVIEMRHNASDIKHLIEIGQEYSLEAIRNEKKRIENEWRENNVI